MKINLTGDYPKHILEEMEKDKPSANAADWAKPGCKHCHGRGVIGVQSLTTAKGGNTIKHELLCTCARKAWKKWQDAWMATRQMMKAENGNGKKPERKPSFGRVMRQVDRIDDNAVRHQVNINELGSEIAAFSHHLQLVDIRDSRVSAEMELIAAEESVAQIYEQAATLEAKSERLRDESQRLLQKARALTGSAAERHQRAGEVEADALRNAQEKVQTIQLEEGEVERDFNKRTHQLKKRRRESQKQLDRLLSRRSRVMSEAGIDSVSQETTVD